MKTQPPAQDLAHLEMLNKNLLIEWADRWMKEGRKEGSPQYLCASQHPLSEHTWESGTQGPCICSVTVRKLPCPQFPGSWNMQAWHSPEDLRSWRAFSAWSLRALGVIHNFLSQTFYIFNVVEIVLRPNYKEHCVYSKVSKGYVYINTAISIATHPSSKPNAWKCLLKYILQKLFV